MLLRSTLPRWARPCPPPAGRAPATGRPLRPGVTRGGGGGRHSERAMVLYGPVADWQCTDGGSTAYL